MSAIAPVSHIQNVDPGPFCHADIVARCRTTLSANPPLADRDMDAAPDRGDHDLNPGTMPGMFADTKKRAAVLLGIVDRPDGPTIVLTRRSQHLKSHAGQIALPGGKIDRSDSGPEAAALRESHEEVGLDPTLADPLGYLDLYETGTGYRVVPVVVSVASGFEPVPEPGEVDAIFEMPVAILADRGRFEKNMRVFRGQTRYFYAIRYGDHYIWGATAGILRNFHDRVFAS